MQFTKITPRILLTVLLVAMFAGAEVLLANNSQSTFTFISDDDMEEYYPEYEGRLWGGTGGFHPAWQSPEISNLNTSLSHAGLPELSKNAVKFGGGGGGYISNLYIGGRGGGFSLTAENDDISTTLIGGFGFFQLGYALLHSYSYIVTPVAGIGSGSFTLEVESDNAPFGGIRTEETERTLMMDFGLNFEFFPMFRRFPAKAGISFGIQAGYILQMNDGSWRTANMPYNELDIDAFGVPDMSGFYAGISIGGGFGAPD